MEKHVFLLGSCNLNDYLHGGFEVEYRDLFASIVLKKLILKYGRPNCGRNRATFISKKFVLKFPLNDHGEIDNINEYNFKNPNVAKSKLIKINEFSCLMQEKLSIISDIKNFDIFPEWIKLIDSYQVGLRYLKSLVNIKELSTINSLM